MGRRKHFKHIVHNLTCTFISRNNDVDGYWGIGKLYSHMDQSGASHVAIDLLTKTIQPPTQDFDTLVEHYATWLSTQIAQNDLPRESLITAEITIACFPNEPTKAFGDYAPHRMNCRVRLADDKGKVYDAEKNVWCRAHDPQREKKRT